MPLYVKKILPFALVYTLFMVVATTARANEIQVTTVKVESKQLFAELHQDSSKPIKDMCGNCLELKSAFKKLKEFSEKNSTEDHRIFSFYEAEEYNYFLQLEDKYKKDYLHDLYFLKFLKDIKLMEKSAPQSQHCLIIEAKNNTLFKSYSLTKLLKIALEYRKVENSWRVSKVSYFPDQSIEASCDFMPDLSN